MSRINTNVAALRGLRNYNKANQMLDTSLTRLSTGLQINSGKDNPSGLIASETLRLQVTSIEQSIKNSNRANNVIATADGALGEIGGLLNQIRGLVQEGLNDGALSQSEKEANQLQIDTALSAINRIASNTSFAGDKLIDGSKAFQTSASAADAAKLSDFKINEAILGTSSSLPLTATVTTTAEKGELRYSGGALSGAATIEVSGAKGQEVVFLGASASTTDIANAINGVSDSTGVTASIDKGFTFKEAATKSAFTLDSAVANADIAFTRATAGNNADLGGSVSIEIVDTGVNGQAFGLNVLDDGSGNKTIQVTLALDGSGDGTTTANDIINAINNDDVASSLVTAATAAGSDGSGVLDETADAGTDALVNGRSAGDLVLSDIRAGGAQLDVTVTNAGASGAAAAAFDGTTLTLTVYNDSTLDDIASAVNGLAGVDNIIEAFVSGDSDAIFTGTATNEALETDGGLLRLQSENYGSAESVTVNVLNGTFNTFNAAGTATSTDAGRDIGLTINGQVAEGKGLSGTIRTSTVDATISFQEASNVATTQATINVTGGGSLFQIGQDVSAAGQIGIGLEATNTARLGGISGKLYELGTGSGKSLLDVGSNGVTGSDLVEIIDQSLDRVTTLRGRLGALQKNVIETNISTLGVALENISEARSQIVDTDFAVETAAMTKAQILQQSGISVLAIANQAPSQVLSLLG